MEVRELENAQLRERARAALGRYFLQAVSVSFIARFFLTAGHVEDAGNAEEYGTLTIDIGSWSWNVYQTSAPEPWLIQINGLMPENLVRTAVTALVAARGVWAVRVHDVPASVDAVTVASALRSVS